MPRYKDSPEVRAAKKERKEKLREFLSLLDVEDMSDLRSVFKEMVGEVLENGLEAELDDELGYSRKAVRETGFMQDSEMLLPQLLLILVVQTHHQRVLRLPYLRNLVKPML